jgi:hypothetical protein
MLGGALEWKSQSDALKAARYTSRGEALKSLQRLDREGVMWEGGFKGSRMNDLGKGPRSTLKIENQKPKTTNRKRFIHLSSVVEVDAVRGCKVRLPIESMHQSCARVVARHGARHGAPAWCPGMVPRHGAPAWCPAAQSMHVTVSVFHTRPMMCTDPAVTCTSWIGWVGRMDGANPTRCHARAGGGATPRPSGPRPRCRS